MAPSGTWAGRLNNTSANFSQTGMGRADWELASLPIPKHLETVTKAPEPGQERAHRWRLLLLTSCEAELPVMPGVGRCHSPLKPPTPGSMAGGALGLFLMPDIQASMRRKKEAFPGRGENRGCKRNTLFQTPCPLV